MTTINTKYGKILYAARRSAGLTQIDLFIRSGVRDKLISAYENGHTVPSVEKFEKLLNACGFEMKIVKKCEQ